MDLPRKAEARAALATIATNHCGRGQATSIKVAASPLWMGGGRHHGRRANKSLPALSNHSARATDALSATAKTLPTIGKGWWVHRKEILESGRVVKNLSSLSSCWWVLDAWPPDEPALTGGGSYSFRGFCPFDGPDHALFGSSAPLTGRSADFQAQESPDIVLFLRVCPLVR